jgi:hypothetical protein
MTVALTKEQREQAKREQKCMIQIRIDAKYVPREIAEAGGVFSGNFEMCGPMTVERGAELFAMCSKWLKESRQAKEQTPDDK